MAAFLKIEDQRKGTTFYGVDFQVVDDIGSPVNLAGADIRCQFRFKDETGFIQASLKLGLGLTITDAALGLFKIDKIVKLEWPVGTYYFDIPIKFASGDTDTDTEGTMLVDQNVTETTI